MGGLRISERTAHSSKWFAKLALGTICILWVAQGKSLGEPFLSEEGQELLHGAVGVNGSFFDLAVNLETQINQAFCGVATAASILNAVEKAHAVTDQIYYPYPYFTQKDIFDSDCVRASENYGAADPMSPLYVATHGLTLEQEYEILSCYANASIYQFSKEMNISTFRNTVRETLENSGLVAINVQRPVLGQPGGGHFSPLAAYNVKKDMMLFMDVARYKYGPQWFPTEVLYKSTNTTDRAVDQHRGWITVQKGSSEVKHENLPKLDPKTLQSLKECVDRNRKKSDLSLDIFIQCWNDPTYYRSRGPWSYIFIAIVSAMGACVLTLLVQRVYARRRAYIPIEL